MSAAVRLERWLHPEFWPAWLFYLPLGPWLLGLVLRYRSLTVWTLANPDLPLGGIHGDDKAGLQTRLAGQGDDPRVLAAERVTNLGEAQEVIARRGWSFPLILKPDAAQRGAGVRKLKREADLVGAWDALGQDPPAQVLQVYHPGPEELGVFWVRQPGTGQGQIFSLTAKRFPVLRGDGRSTLADLIRRHPRFRLQAETFLTRHRARLEEVLADGETLRLAEAGNHCQGTLFQDGEALRSPGFERALNHVLSRLPGFHFGRLDVRYEDAASLAQGRFAIVELNGVTSESTNVYDPNWPYLRSLLTLARQWALCFAIGDAVRTRTGAQPPTLGELRRALTGYRDQVARLSQLSD